MIDHRFHILLILCSIANVAYTSATNSDDYQSNDSFKKLVITNKHDDKYNETALRNHSYLADNQQPQQDDEDCFNTDHVKVMLENKYKIRTPTSTEIDFVIKKVSKKPCVLLPAIDAVISARDNRANMAVDYKILQICYNVIVTYNPN